MVTVPQTLRRAVKLHPKVRRTLLGCGVVAPAWWVAMDVVGSLRYPGYSYVDQTISELGAEEAPTRGFMTFASGIPYAVLAMAFGAGVWATAGGRRAQRVTGALVAAEVMWGLIGGLLFPMAVRGAEETPRNRIHPVYGAGMPLLFLSAMVSGSRVLGKRFRYFSYGTILALLGCGVLVSRQAGKVPANEPTPYIGIEERINAYAGMLWLAVLAVGLLRSNGSIARGAPGKPTVTPHGVRRERTASPA